MRFLAVSNAIRRRAIDFGIAADKLIVSHLGVDTSKFTPGTKRLSDRRNILFVGRLVEKKGCRYLIEAFSKIQQVRPDIKLVIVGDGPLKAGLERLAFDKGLDVMFCGALPHDQVLEQLKVARIFCLPSVVAQNGDAEGLPVSILEAQSCGVPVITSAVGGAEEGIRDGITGLAHRENDVVSLESALRQLIADGEDLENMGRAARKYMVEEMDIKICAARLERIYDDTCERNYGN